MGINMIASDIQPLTESNLSSGVIFSIHIHRGDDSIVDGASGETGVYVQRNASRCLSTDGRDQWALC